jgi:hypothetical protein
MAAASLRHAELVPSEHHGGIGLRDPHGARVIKRAMEQATLDLGELAETYGQRRGGFLDVYRGAEVTLGLLDAPTGTLAPGPVMLPQTAARSLEAVVAMAACDQVSTTELDQLLPGGCICSVRTGADGAALRRLLFGGPGAPSAPEPVRRARARNARSARLLSAAMEGRPVSASPDDAMAALCCFSDLQSAITEEDQQSWALYWRGALLRNASVTAWRWLWWWLTEQLRARPQSATDLGDALGSALVAAAGSDAPARHILIESLPLRIADGRLLDAESAILYPDGYESNEPLDYLRCLALGALRLDDLDGPAKQAFCEHGDLGPTWVRRWLGGLGNNSLSAIGRTLTGLLLRQADEVSRRRAQWDQGRLRLPTRLRQLGDVLDLAGEEGSTAPGLRLSRLTQILGELNVLDASASVFCAGAAAESGW